MGRMHSKAFTLIELMVTLAVLGIFAAIAIPSMSNLIETNRVQGATEELLSQLQYARAEAVVRNRVVTVENTSGINGNWSDGLRIFASANRVANTAYNQANDGPALREHPGFDQEGLTLNSNADRYLSFRPNGSLASAAEVLITVCFNNKTDKARQISVQPSGRARTTPSATIINTCTP